MTKKYEQAKMEYNQIIKERDEYITIKQILENRLAEKIMIEENFNTL